MPRLSQGQLDVRVEEIRHRWPAVGLAGGVVRVGSPVSFCCRGFADIAARTPVTQDTVFRIASISKTFTAVAVLQLWERGLVDLDAPANEYLRAYRLIPRASSWRPATVRHLLTHTAGIPEWVHPTRMINSGWFGESFGLGEHLPTLAEYYAAVCTWRSSPARSAPTATTGSPPSGRSSRTSAGGPWRPICERTSSAHWGWWTVTCFGPNGSGLVSRRATGWVRGAARPLTDRRWVTEAASSIYSTPRDMARYVAALLGEGAGSHGAILNPETLPVLFRSHYQPDPRIPGMGLAFFRVDMDGHATVEHQGVLPGFNSQIFLAPEDGVGVVAFTNGSRNAATWLTAESQRLLGDLIGAPPAAIRTDIAQHPEIWAYLCGWYRPRAQRTDMQAWSILGAGVEVAVRRGRLLLRTLSPIPGLRHGLPLQPDNAEDPSIFRVDLSRYGMPPARIVFSRSPAGAMSVHLDGLPLSADQRPPTTLRRRCPRPAGTSPS